MKNTIMVIFGGSGDLTKRKLMPALYNLHKNGRVNENFKILAVGRTEYNNKEFRDFTEKNLRLSVPQEDQNDIKIANFLSIIGYHTMDPSDKGDYDSLKELLAKTGGISREYVFYLAT